jgi:hypothetical protein
VFNEIDKSLPQPTLLESDNIIDENVIEKLDDSIPTNLLNDKNIKSDSETNTGMLDESNLKDDE